MCAVEPGRSAASRHCLRPEQGDLQQGKEDWKITWTRLISTSFSAFWITYWPSNLTAIVAFNLLSIKILFSILLCHELESAVLNKLV